MFEKENWETNIGSSRKYIHTKYLSIFKGKKYFFVTKKCQQKKSRATKLERGEEGPRNNIIPWEGPLPLSCPASKKFFYFIYGFLNGF